VTAVAIRINGLGKEYPLRHGRTPYKTAREAIIHGLSAPFRGFSPGTATRNSTRAESAFGTVWGFVNMSGVLLLFEFLRKRWR